jgi:hypothetical protein
MRGSGEHKLFYSTRSINSVMNLHEYYVIDATSFTFYTNEVQRHAKYYTTGTSMKNVTFSHKICKKIVNSSKENSFNCVKKAFLQLI